MRFAAVLLAGCAPGMSAMHPADVLGQDEMHAGASLGIAAPIGGRSGAGPARAARQIASPAAFSGEAQIRRGFEGAWEAGLRLSPAGLGADARWQIAGRNGWVTSIGAGAEAIAMPSLVTTDVPGLEPDGGWRGEAVVELLVGRNWSDVLRVWLGPRVAFGRFALDGTVEDEAFDAAGWTGRAGGTFGVATGYRWIFAVAEITPSWVFASGDANGEALRLSEVVVFPSFGLWVRF